MNREKPSQTARKVALNVVALGACREMDPVLPAGIVEASARLLVESGAVGERAVRFAGTRAAAWIYRFFDWMMPGQFEAFGRRKAFCERQVREGIAMGARQVLVLGAGYDTLGWRLAPEFPGVRFFEIDHPASARSKARGIESMGRRANLHLLAEDLGQKRLSDVLSAQPSWDPGVQTVLLAEGLLMYLPPEGVEGLLEQCAAATGEGSRIAFSYVGRRPDGRPDAGAWTGLVLWLLKAAGEEWLWAVSPEEIGPFLAEHGWQLDPSSGSAVRQGIEYYAAAVRGGCD